MPLEPPRSANAGVTGEKTRERMATMDRNFFMGGAPFGFERERLVSFFKINLLGLDQCISAPERQRFGIRCLKTWINYKACTAGFSLETSQETEPLT